MKQDENTGLWVNEDGSPAKLVRPEVLERFKKDETDQPETDSWWQG